MENVNVWKCSFCKRISENKKSIQKHEKKCFFNPETKSCATCLWFSPLIADPGYPVRCYLDLLEETPKGTRKQLKTKCERWMNKKIYFDHETCENDDEMEENLLNGNEDYFKNLQRLSLIKI
ncbi:MAG: hypothetical protein GXY51_04095 [Bacteroidetes bacterium]|nr:hypothetical protein [Bacteroidota bacterium]